MIVTNLPRDIRRPRAGAHHGVHARVRAWACTSICVAPARAPVGQRSSSPCRASARLRLRSSSASAASAPPLHGSVRRSACASSASIRARLNARRLGARLHPPDQLDRLLPIADFVTLTMPHTPKTEGLFDARRFRRMKKSAFFINVGRGMTTRLDDLNRALRNGIIAGAGLDVYEIEPLPNDHPLWSAPNILLTPHVAADGPDLEPARQALHPQERTPVCGRRDARERGGEARDGLLKHG